MRQPQARTFFGVNSHRTFHVKQSPDVPAGRPPALLHPGVRPLYHAQAFILVLILALVASACTVGTNPVTGRKRAYGYTWEQERQIGQQADQQIQRQFGIYEDPELQAYVERVGQEVLQESHLRRPDADPEFRNTPFVFRVLDSPTVNAFALPGGYIYVTRGLLAHLENEAQLAVVLGHEVGHVAARHASARAARAQLGQIGLIGGAILGQEVLGLPAGDLLDIGGTAAQLLFLRYSRGDESESDELGVEYAALAGYQAGEGAAFFGSLQRLGEQQGGGLPTFLSTHPDPGQREQRIPRLAAQWEGQTNMTRVEREEYLSHLEGVVLGENPRQGFTQDNTFYHPELRFQFPVPSGFVVQNSAAQVDMMEQNQQAYLGFTFAQASSAQEAAAQFARMEGLQVIESGQDRAGELPAYVVLGAGNLQNQEVRLLGYFVEHGGNVYQFLGLAPAQLFSRYQDVFLRTMRGFRALTDQRILNAQPTRLNVVQAPRTAPFQSFVPGNLPPQITAEQLAILNQVTLNEQIQQGRLLKLPQQ